MKSFLLKVTILLLPVLIFLGCYEVLLRESNLPNIYSFKDDLLNSEYEAIVLGNSHALRGILAEDFSYDVINLANVSQSIDIDLLWLKEALKVQKLKFIILNFSVPTLTGALIQSPESWRLKNYNLYTRLQLNCAPKYNFEFLNGLQRNNLALIQNHLSGNITFQDNYLLKGSYPLDLTSENFTRNASKAAKRHSSNVIYINRNKHILNEIIALSKINSFDIVLVIPPAHSSYRRAMSDKLIRDLFTFLVAIENKNNNVFLLNYFDDFDFKNNSFKDADHLNLKGAKLFTLEINNFLLNHYSNRSK